MDKRVGLENKADRNATDCPPQYRSNIHFRPVSGLMSGINSTSAPSRAGHSGMMQMINSITVAGAVPALPESNQSAPASRLTLKKELEGT